MIDKKSLIIWCRHSDLNSILEIHKTIAPFAIVVNDSDIVKQLRMKKKQNDTKILYEVTSPLGNAINNHFELTQALSNNPSSSDVILQKYKQETEYEIQQAIQLGTDGIFYRLIGAEPCHTTPMQYGGFYLEIDRELLGIAKNLTNNVLYVEGKEDSYLDFVHDLPAQILAWESASWDIEKVEQVHRGPLAIDIEWMITNKQNDQNKNTNFYLAKLNSDSNQNLQLMIRNIEQLRCVSIHE